jgi:hypothetical protein
VTEPDIYLDNNEQPLRVGSRVQAPNGSSPPGTIRKIFDAEGDVDERGRPFAVPPEVRVEWDGRQEGEDFERFVLQWTGEWNGDPPIFKTDELELFDPSLVRRDPSLPPGYKRCNHHSLIHLEEDPCPTCLAEQEDALFP